ncbi:enoyl-CoA hydratase/carnithine racemase [Candidatus Scalindua japonica]|uniref:Enoyl-CoA hydratase/carnithine racemase n=1 Tax=Candidatus Scalindua japonica TaxID=1284222 RepID=A0A286TXJ4_9BACT|nr:hypothetical protein [Candidatus Scalindua japonica]GAX60597.1 enoyl-CoA hydratase/carnithine racemase [Candidatus Scalindua japonica]
MSFLFKADGSDSAGYGGGSGGGININVGTLSGAGGIRSVGGSNNSPGSGGGGGRIAVYFDDISDFDMDNITAYGGDGSSGDGGAGTIYLKSSVQAHGDLIVDNNNLVTTTDSTPLRSTGKGAITALSATVLTDANASFPVPDPVTGALGLIGLELDPDTNDADTATFTIVDNTETTITIDIADGELTTVAAIGDTYIGEHYFDNLSVINGAKVETQDRIIFNSLFITGGELQAENIYQIGKVETSPIEKLVKHQKDNMQRERDRRRIIDDGRGPKGKARLTKEEKHIINKEFDAHKVKLLIPAQQYDDEAITTETVKEEILDNYKETAKVDAEVGETSG